MGGKLMSFNESAISAMPGVKGAVAVVTDEGTDGVASSPTLGGRRSPR